MKNGTLFLIALTILWYCGCAHGSREQIPGTNLSATEFAEKTKQMPAAPILDVRTPAEFSQGHLQNAINIDWQGNDFQDQVSKLDKSKPVFVYCLSGKRSGAAANQMRTDGFAEVYVLDGGILKWRAANLPETISNAIP